ncbi:hypothetical protein ABTN28_19355, partial [Acinetobacter baumannii]
MTKMVRNVAVALAAGMIALVGTAAEAKPKLTGEQELAKLLEGRIAGKPVDCIYTPTVSSSRVIDKTAIVYDTGRTI